MQEDKGSEKCATQIVLQQYRGFITNLKSGRSDVYLHMHDKLAAIIIAWPQAFGIFEASFLVLFGTANSGIVKDPNISSSELNKCLIFSDWGAILLADGNAEIETDNEETDSMSVSSIPEDCLVRNLCSFFSKLVFSCSMARIQGPECAVESLRINPESCPS